MRFHLETGLWRRSVIEIALEVKHLMIRYDSPMDLLVQMCDGLHPGTCVTERVRRTTSTYEATHTWIRDSRAKAGTWMWDLMKLKR